MGLSNVDRESDTLADLVFKHFPEWKDKVYNLKSKLESLMIPVPNELKEFNVALTGCLENRQVQKTLERFKKNLDVIEKGVARVKELEESLNEETEKELRQLKGILEVHVNQLQQVDEGSAIKEAAETLESHLSGHSPWRGYADIKPMAEHITQHYQQIRAKYKERQKDELNTQIDQIKLRPDFSDLDLEKQQEVLQKIRNAFIDVDEQAVQPALLLIKQTPDRIKEASALAHRLLDDLINEPPEVEGDDEPEPTPPKPRVHIVSLGLRNKVISDKDELERMLSNLKQKCLKELDQGIKVRFEE